MKSTVKPSYRTLILAVFMAALAVRVAYLNQIKASPLFYHLAIDPKFYHEWALRIAGGGWLGDEVFYMSPLYPYFLAGLIKLVTTDLFYIRLIQMALGALGCILVMDIALRVFGKTRIALLAGMGAALYAPFIYYDGQVMKTWLEAFLLIATVWFLVREKRGNLNLLGSGACLALGVLARENLIILLPVLGVAFLVLNRDEALNARVKRAAVFVLGFCLVIFPVSIRNYAVSGEFVLITNLGGLNLYIGNNPDANGFYKPPEFLNPNPMYELEDFRREASRQSGRELAMSEMSRFWYRKSFDWISGNPWQFLKLTVRRLFLFWNFYEAPDNENYYYFKTIAPVLRGPLPGFGLIGPLGLIGMILAWRGGRRPYVLYLTFGAYVFSLMLLFNLSRYRILIVPIVIVFAAFTVDWLLENGRTILKDRKWVTYASLPVLLFLCNRPVEGLDPHVAGFEAMEKQLGSAYAENGQYEEAIRSFERALAVKGDDPFTQVNLAHVYFTLGRFEKAGELYDRAARRKENFAEAWNGLGNVAVQLNEPVASFQHYQKAVTLAPRVALYHSNYGFALEKLGKLEEAEREQKEALRLDPGYGNAYWGLASLYEKTGRYREALECWEQFVRLSPAPAWLDRAREKMRQLDQAMNSRR